MIFLIYRWHFLGRNNQKCTFEIRIRLENNFDRNWGISRAKLCSTVNVSPGPRASLALTQTCPFSRIPPAEAPAPAASPGPGSGLTSPTLPGSPVHWGHLGLWLSFCWPPSLDHFPLTFCWHSLMALGMFLLPFSNMHFFFSPLMVKKIFPLPPKVSPSQGLWIPYLWLLYALWFYLPNSS